MKHFFICILLLVFFSKNSRAQKYQPYDTNMVWKVFQTGNLTSISGCYRTEAQNYFVKGYITNNNKLWHKVFATIIQNAVSCDPSFVPANSIQFIGMFSNDTANKKVYFVPTSTLPVNFTPTISNLIFDSNKNIGDIMSVYSGGDPSTVIGLNYQITKIDSVLLGTKYHKRFIGTTTFWQNYSPVYAYFIEGVGASGGVFNSAFNVNVHRTSKTGCFSNTNYTKYYAGQYNWNMSLGNFPLNLRDTSTCFTALPSSVTINTVIDKSLNVFPNPVKDKLIVEFENKNANAINFVLTNSLGQPIPVNSKTINSQLEIDTSNLPNGIYYLKVKSPVGQKVFKVVKE